MRSKLTIIIFLTTLTTAGLFIWSHRSNTAKLNPITSSNTLINKQIDPSAPPKIVSTKPDPLENNIVSAGDIVEITFNRPLENVGEFKSKIEPKIDYKVELSGDRKTAKIVPAKPFQLGTTYTLFIGPESKFDGIGRWGEEKIFHFKTITYRGV